MRFCPMCASTGTFLQWPNVPSIQMGIEREAEKGKPKPKTLMRGDIARLRGEERGGEAREEEGKKREKKGKGKKRRERRSKGKGRK